MDQKKQTTPEQRYRTLVNSILDTAGDGILTFDAEGRIETVNPAALKVFMYAADEMIGQSLTHLLVAEEQKTYADFLVSSPPPEGNTFVRGNCDGQSPAQVGTGIFLFNWLFLSGPIPACIAACDTDGDGANSINDGVFLLNYLFLNGNTPPGWVDGDGDGTAEETCEFAPETECRESQGTCAS